MGPNPGENRVVAGDGRERKIGPTLGIEDGEQPLHVSNRRFEKVRDLSEIGCGGDREHLAEYAAVFAFSN